ncbi:cation channel sperm-associated protein 2-like [Salminus brasiliensis]|uniref:cation channel sperm-associated protein 2-like n=1 Tax=Salminus brasiliensis TaxID=930266 RepID=UPI003B834B73
MTSSLCEEEQRGGMKSYMAKFLPRDTAQRILGSTLFQNVMVLLILLNVVVLVVQAELSDSTAPSMQRAKLVLTALDWCILVIFLLEMLLKWLDNFRQFWKSPWDIFDFTVTILSVLPEVINAFTETQTAGFLVILRQFRVLRTLKMVIRIRPLRLTLLIIVKSLKGTTATFLLLAVLGYVFALVGIALFEEYTQSDTENLNYKDSFKDLSNSVCTLFILFTGDNWHDLLKDTWRVPDLHSTAVNIFIVLWVVLAGFMVKMVLMADVVSSFEHTRKELTKEVQQIKQKQGELNSSECAREEVNWDAFVTEKMQGIDEQEVQRMIWPRETLLEFLELMEKLQENVEERRKLQKLEVQSYLNLHS